jgi:hypothetical protein
MYKEREIKMFGITNWKTSLAGAAAAAAAFAAQVPSLKQYADTLGLIAAALIGFAAKDANVTGGTVPQTEEATVRVEMPEVLTEAHPANSYPPSKAHL